MNFSGIVRPALCGAVLLAVPVQAIACSSCGCSLSSDWSSQGYSAGPGFLMDLRYDYFDQNQLRVGTGAVDRGSIVLPSDREIQQKTVNKNTTVALDYSSASSWGVTVLVPYFDRFHTTIAPGDADTSTSSSKSVGDVRILGRYHGIFDDHGTGVQFGVKLPTGSIRTNFFDGPQAGELLDRGLQPGTGTSDLLVGLYHFAAMSRDWDYFAQALVQQPMNSRDGFRPGTGINVNAGVRYVASETVVPHLQVNIRSEGREAGANADVENSGATLVHLSPGATISLGKAATLYGFVQIPLYQRVNGYQIEPRYSVSIGIRYAFK